MNKFIVFINFLFKKHWVLVQPNWKYNLLLIPTANQLNWFTVFRKEQKGKKEAAAEKKRKKSDTASETEPESKRQKTTEDKKQTTEENDKEDDRAETEKNGDES